MTDNQQILRKFKENISKKSKDTLVNTIMTQRRMIADQTNKMIEIINLCNSYSKKDNSNYLHSSLNIHLILFIIFILLLSLFAYLSMRN